MKRISICSWCGQPFDSDDDEQETDVCGECFVITDEVGLIEDDDLKFIRGDD